MSLKTITVLILLTTSATAQTFPSSLPGELTPGAVNVRVTQENIHDTICHRGWAKSVRPPEKYTERIKREQVRAMRYVDQNLKHYELDHLIPLELGGAPRDRRNLWAEYRHPFDLWGSSVKDRLENHVHHLVCTGKVSLREAQQAFAHNWIDAYKKYMKVR